MGQLHESQWCKFIENLSEIQKDSLIVHGSLRTRPVCWKELESSLQTDKRVDILKFISQFEEQYECRLKLKCHKKGVKNLCRSHYALYELDLHLKTLMKPIVLKSWVKLQRNENV